MASLARPLLGISRVPFLLLPVVLVAAGAAASAFDSGSFSWVRALLALLGLVAAHVGVNALNEACDMQTGIDLETERTPFSGGSGTLPSGALGVKATYLWGFFALAVAAAVGIYFLLEVGLVLLPILLLGLVMIVAYTHVLARVGVGEIAAGLGLGTLPILGTSLVLDGHIGWAAIAAAVPAFFMTFGLLLLNEFPDETADRRGGRKNLVLLLGRPGAARVWAAAVVATPLTLGVAVVLGALPPLALVACLPALFVVPGLRWALRAPETPVPMPALGGNVVWNLATNAVLAAALVATATWV